MKTSRTPWAAKMRPDMKMAIVDDPKGPGRMLLPTPLLVAEEIRKVRKGSLVSMSDLRERLARREGADRTCPLMTGIFFNIVAGLAEEQLARNEAPIAPYWRVVRDNGTLSPKTPSGPDRQAEHLRREGHVLEATGGKSPSYRCVNQVR